MSKPRKHHYVPEMLQRQFADPDGHMWFFDKTEAAFGVRRRPIARLLRELHLYTTVAPDGTRDTKTETELSKIESKAGPILEQIIQRARNGEAPQLTSSEREIVSLFLIAQLRRAPEFFDEAIKHRDIKERLTDVLRRLEESRGQIPAEMKRQLFDPPNLARMQSNLFAGGAAEPLFFSIEGMMLRGFTASIITDPNFSFINRQQPHCAPARRIGYERYLRSDR
nr:DUF4238 domain-containing protein [Methylobacterium sp. L1A1]